MEHELRIKFRAGNDKKTSDIRDKVASLIEEEECSISSSSVCVCKAEYEVSGVDTETKQPFSEIVEADSEEEAKNKSQSETRVVVGVRNRP